MRSNITDTPINSKQIVMDVMPNKIIINSRNQTNSNGGYA